MELNDLLDSLSESARYTGTMHLNSYEETEAYEIENFLVKQGKSPSVARKMAVTAVKKPAYKKPLQNAARANGGQGIVMVGGGKGTPAFSAQFDIKVKRVSANIASALPFVLFGQLDQKNGYRQLLSSLPSGVVLTSVDCGESDGAPDKLIFTFTSSTNVDTVEVSCNQYPYPSFLESMATNMFKASKVRYGISDGAQQSQFNNSFEVATRSMFGRKSSDTVSIASFKDPNQQQANLIDVNGEFSFDRETAIVSSINAVAGFEVNLSMFIEAFVRETSKGL